MKSIKETSEEYGLQYPVIHYDVSGNPCDDVEEPSMDFEMGANYVLEMFVDIVNKNTKPNGIEDRAKMAYDMLILIEQLKK